MALRLLHSAKLPEYTPQLFSLGVTVLSKAGHTANWITKFKPYVARRTIPKENPPRIFVVRTPRLKRYVYCHKI